MMCIKFFNQQKWHNKEKYFKLKQYIFWFLFESSSNFKSKCVHSDIANVIKIFIEMNDMFDFQNLVWSKQLGDITNKTV